MCQPRKWWWGLLPLALLWAGAVYVLTPQIEGELTHRAIVALHSQRSWVTTAIDGRDIIIKGEAPSEQARRQAMNTVLRADGVRLAINTAGLLPEVKPFTWSAAREAGKLTLSGFIAPDGSREKILTEARRLLPGETVVDEMKIAAGAPEAAPAMNKAALKALAKLKTGSVALVDNTLAIKGVAPDAAAATAILAATKKLPATMRVASVDITPETGSAKSSAIPVERPYVWQGTREGNVLTLSGFVPSEPARIQVVAASKSAMGGGRVIDQLKIASGLPQSVDFGAASSFALTQLSQIRNGAATLTDGKLAIEGEALNAAGYRNIAAAASAPMPGGIKLDRAAVAPPRVATYAWSAKRDAKSLTLKGYYPDEGTHYMMAQAAAQRFGDLKLHDRTTIASGAPAGFTAAVGMGLDQLSQLESGEVSIAGGRMIVSGVAADEKKAGAVKEALTKLVGGMPAEARITLLPPAPEPPAPVVSPPMLAPNAVAPPVVPPAAVPAPMAMVAPATKPAPPPTAVEPAAPKPATAETGAATTEATKVPASEIATPPAATAPAVPPAPAVPRAAPAPPAKAASAAPPAGVADRGCAADADHRMADSRIRFRSASAYVLPSSRKTVNRLISLMKQCADLKVEVAGYTDSIGSADFNNGLSTRRAEAISALLARSGVEPARVHTAGYGASKPIASNATPSGRARNRRIEFHLVR